jgi:hypothetical protein
MNNTTGGEAMIQEQDEQTMIDRDDEIIGQPMAVRPTKRDLVERGLDALDPTKMRPAQISTAAGGISFKDVIEVMDFAKGMATGGVMVPKYLRGNPGACLGIIFQAIEWRMSPFQVANKSYAVNDRVGYESQLIHAVVEARAPLQHRLDCRYDGEGPTRTCTITGMFTSGDVREYTTPEFSKIRTKNSPLWQDDPDQQLFYYASRAWARKWVPDVLMGIYAREELAERPGLGREVSDDDAPGLHARLASSERAAEGHQDGHAARELDQIAGAGQIIEHELPDRGKTPPRSPARKRDEQGPSDQPPVKNKRASELPRASQTRTKGEKDAKEADSQGLADKSRAAKLSEKLDAEIKSVRTVADYVAYAKKWIKACDDSTELFVRWTAERKLRNTLGVTGEDRQPLDKLIEKRRGELEP